MISVGLPPEIFSTKIFFVIKYEFDDGDNVKSCGFMISISDPYNILNKSLYDWSVPLEEYKSLILYDIFSIDKFS